jgi:hypothetical protein
MQSCDDKDLDDLQWHWGGAYVIGHTAADLWLAQRRDDRKVLRATNPAELLELIRADYAERPVTRYLG